MKVSPGAVTIPGRKAWKNKRLASGIVTRLRPALFNFLEWRAPRAKEKLRSMEQCFRAKAGKRRLSARRLFHDCSTEHARGEDRGTRGEAQWTKSKLDVRNSREVRNLKFEVRQASRLVLSVLSRNRGNRFVGRNSAVLASQRLV